MLHSVEKFIYFPIENLFVIFNIHKKSIHLSPLSQVYTEFNYLIKVRINTSNAKGDLTT